MLPGNKVRPALRLEKKTTDQCAPLLRRIRLMKPKGFAVLHTHQQIRLNAEVEDG
jgi:hypothetical protein